MNILIHVGTVTFFNSLLELALVLKSRKINCVFLFDNPYPNYLNDLDILRENEFKYLIYLNDENRDLNNHFTFRGTKYLIYFGKRIFGSGLVSFLQEIKRLKRKDRFFDNLLIRLNITHLIMASDLVQYDTGLFLKIAKKRKIRSIVLPQFFANYRESAEHVFFSLDNQISSKFYFLLNKIPTFKKWTLIYKGKYLIRLPFHNVLAKEMFDISPFNPWVINTGGADLIILEGAAIKNFILNEISFPEDKLIVGGSINNDRLFVSLSNYSINKNKLIEQFNFSFSKPIALIAIPPNMFSSRHMSTEFNSYYNLLKFWLSAISNLKKYSVLLSLHPAISEDETNFIKNFGFPIYNKPIVDCIALIDLFVASISATIQWAIACGIPVLNYDVYDYQYEDYNSVEGVLYVKDSISFNQKIESLNNLEYLSSLSALQKNHSHQWGVLDGNFANRLSDLIYE